MRNFESRIASIIVTLLMLVFSSTTDLNAQCTFNCVDTVNVSVNNLCTATITPAVILKNPSLTCSYGIELFDQSGRQINLNASRADIGPQYVGQLLKVRIFDSGFGVQNPNECWGFVKVEDKLPPEILCVGNDTLDCFGTDIFETDESAAAHLKREIERTLIDNCGNEEVTVNISQNILIDRLCQDSFAAMRIVAYNVLDNNDNVTSCEDTILYKRFVLDSLDAPKNYVDDMAIDCNEPYPSIEYLVSLDRESPGQNSMPNVDGVSIADYADSLFTERGLCNFKMTTTDLVFETCGNTYKLVRNWTVIDWCDASIPKIFNQVIKVTDTEIRQNAISNMGPFDAVRGSCQASVELPFPAVAADECNDWTYTIYVRGPDGELFFPFGGQRDSVPQVVTRDFPVGVSTVRYVVEDACSNEDIVEFDVTIEDNEAPIPVCDSKTVVTLNDSFLGKALASTFDDGSYDACSGIASFKVRRVDRATTVCETPDDFDDFVKFCCADIGKRIMVEFQVTDGRGLTANCMTEVSVQFKGAGPSVTCAPNIGVQSCTNYEDFDVTTLTPPTITSNNACIADALEAEVRISDRAMDVCGDGFIEVEWFYNVTGDEEVVCSYTINFENFDPFTEADINWPIDRDVTTCDEAPPTIMELENIVDANRACSNVLVSDPVDRIFEDVPNRCLRILRTWTVVDWCRFPADPSARWTYEQTIDVINSEGPVIDVSEANLTLNAKPDSCRAIMRIEGIAIDDCTPSDDLDWTYRLDLVRGGVEIPLIFERPGRVLERRIDAGNYIMTWSATDACGNRSVARQSFTVEDEVLPTAVCGFAIKDVDSISNTAIVTAIELNNGSFDNCNDELVFKIRRANSNAELTDAITFTCSDLGVNEVELWVEDYMGNQSMCLATVDIRDGDGTCGFGASLTIEGIIKTEEDVPVESAQVMLMKNASLLESNMTEVDGIYNFENIEENQNYTLRGEKNDDYLNGISTLDLVMMQRHILGLSKLESPYKLIAADINNSSSITAVDIVILRRLILGHINELPDNDSWRFIDKDLSFADPSRPWNLPEEIGFQNLDNSINKEFVAVKIGDLNANAIANTSIARTRSNKRVSLTLESKVTDRSVTYNLIATEDYSSPGFQIGLKYDDDALTFAKASNIHTNIVDEMIAKEKGTIKVSLAGARSQTYEKGDIVLSLEFALGNNGSSDLENLTLLDNNTFESEIYSDELESQGVELKSLEYVEDVVLYQNRPNPFDQNTLIEFDIPKAQDVTFEVFDAKGSRVFSSKQRFSAGKNSLSVNKDALSLNKGIYYYQIRTEQRSLIKKMIIL